MATERRRLPDSPTTPAGPTAATDEKAPDGLDMFYARDRAAWHDWLEAGHASKRGVWLVYYKQGSGRTRVSYDDAVDEAIAFGWVDSRPNKLDDERYMQLFSPRKPGSPWSRINKDRVERLVGQGRMTPAGLAAVKTAKENGAWNAYDGIEDLAMPEDLGAALEENPTAAANFDAFPPSSKKNIFWWVSSAKNAETRCKRIEKTVSMAEQDLRANHYRQPGQK